MDDWVSGQYSPIRSRPCNSGRRQRPARIPYYDPYSSTPAMVPDRMPDNAQEDLFSLEPWWDQPQGTSSGYPREQCSARTQNEYMEYSAPRVPKRRFRNVMTPSYDYLEFSPPSMRSIQRPAPPSVNPPQYMEFSPPQRRRLARAPGQLQRSPPTSMRIRQPVYMEFTPPSHSTRTRRPVQRQDQEELQEDGCGCNVAEADLLGLDTPEEAPMAMEQPMYGAFPSQRNQRGNYESSLYDLMMFD